MDTYIQSSSFFIDAISAVDELNAFDAKMLLEDSSLNQLPQEMLFNKLTSISNKLLERKEIINRINDNVCYAIMVWGDNVQLIKDLNNVEYLRVFQEYFKLLVSFVEGNIKSMINLSLATVALQKLLNNVSSKPSVQFDILAKYFITLLTYSYNVGKE